MSAKPAPRIEEFLQILRSLQFHVSIHQIIDAHKLIIALSEQQRWPSDLSRQASLIAPVVCSSAADQAVFRKEFEQWVRTFEKQTDYDADRPNPTTQPQIAPSSKRNKGIAAALGVLLFLIAGIGIGIYAKWRTPEPIIPSATKLNNKHVSVKVVKLENSEPIIGARMRFRGTLVQSDSGSVDLGELATPVTALITADKFFPAVITVNPGDGNRVVFLSPRSVRLPGNGVQTVTNWIKHPATKWISNNGIFVLILGFFAPFVAVPIYFVFERRAMVLRRWRSSIQQMKTLFDADRVCNDLFSKRSIRRVASSLINPPQFSKSYDFDPEMSVHRTLNAGGLLTISYKARRTRPEYLCLIEQLTSVDHCCNLHDLLCDQLEAAGVLIDRFYYSSDPRLCYPKHNKSQQRLPLRLEDLSIIFPHHTVCVFGSFLPFLEPFAWRLNAAGEFLRAWPRAAIFDDSVSEADSRKKQPFRDSTILLLDDRLEALEGLYGALESNTRSVTDRFPRILRQLPERWLSREHPDDASLLAISTALRRFLEKDGYLCLRACAVYPELSWELTVHLVQELILPDHRETVLRKLARLPWFRYGMMPDWLRLHLLEGLRRDTRNRIDRALNVFLERLTLAEHKKSGLKIAGKVTPTLSEQDSNMNPLQDAVFASFILGFKIRKLDVRIPSTLRALLTGQLTGGQGDWGITGMISLNFAVLFGLIIWFMIVCIGNLHDIPQTQQVAQPGPIIAVPYVPPSEMRQATLVDVAAALADKEAPGVFTDRVISLYNDILANNVITKNNLVLSSTGKSRTIGLPSFRSNPLRLPDSFASLIQPGMVSFALDGVVESVDRTNGLSIVIRHSDINTLPHRENIRIIDFRDLWDPKTGNYYSVRQALVLPEASTVPMPSPQGPAVPSPSEGFAGLGPAQTPIANNCSSGQFLEASAQGEKTWSLSFIGDRLVGSRSDNSCSIDLLHVTGTGDAWSGTLNCVDGQKSALILNPDKNCDYFVSNISWFKLGPRVAAASDSGGSLKLVAILQSSGPVYTASFSPNGQFVVTAGADGNARLWSVPRHEILFVVNHSGSVYATAFSPDSQLLVTADADGTVKLSSLTRFAIESIRAHSKTIRHTAFSPNGRLFVTASDDTTARIWSVAKPKQPTVTLEGHSSRVFSAMFSPDGQRIVTASDDNTARVWNVASGEELISLRHSGPVSNAVFSPNGDLILTASGDSTARLWDANSGKLLVTFRGHTKAVFSAEFSPDGQRVVTASDDGTVRVWNPGNGQLLATLNGHSGPVVTAVFSPDGQRILTASDDSTARVWDATSGALLATLQGHVDILEGAVFSPNGQLILTTSRDGTARLWNIF